MKDYTIKEEDKKTFILNYEINKDREIIIHLADGNTYTVPYTKKNENEVLERMKEQVIRTNDFKFKQSGRSLKALKKIGFFAILMVIDIGLAVAGIGIVAYIAMGCCAVVCITNAIIFHQCNEKLDGLELEDEYINKETELNKALKVNKNILSNVNEKTQEYVETVFNNNFELDLNKIDNISYKDLKIMLENLKRAEELNFDFQSQEKEKPAVLTKKI